MLHYCYDLLRDKYRKQADHMMHINTLINYLLSRYTWEGLPEHIPQSMLETILICNGTAGFGVSDVDHKLWAFAGGYGGDVDGYLGNRYHGALASKGDFDGLADSEIAVCWNNATRTPELILYQTASILTEIDVSERLNVLFARFVRIPRVRDAREKDAYINAIKNVLDGKMDAVVSDNLFAGDAHRLLGDNSDSDNMLELTDVKDIDKLQYLNQYRDNVYKRFWSIYGQTTQVTSKLAQMSPDEIHANDDTSLILLLQGLKYRREFCDKVRRIFGIQLSVKLSECFENERREASDGAAPDSSGADHDDNGGDNDA